jgi:hypothetical protein
MAETDDLLNPPRPVGIAAGVGTRLVDDDGCRCVIVLFGGVSRASRTVGLVAVVATRIRQDY